MTFANIQGIRVNANPIERLLGLANVEVGSAGGGDTAHGEPSSGTWVSSRVDNAEAIAICLSSGYGCTRRDWARRRLKHASRFLCPRPVKCSRRRGHCGLPCQWAVFHLATVIGSQETSL